MITKLGQIDQGKKNFSLNPMGGRPGLPGVAVESTAAATVTASGGLST